MVDRLRFLKVAAGGGVTLAAVFAFCFLLLHALPGDPAEALDAAAMTPENLSRTRAALGLDRPLPERFVTTATSYLRGDLGVSISRRRPVARALAEAVPATALLAAPALLLAYPLGVGLGLAVGSAPSRRRRIAEAILLGVSAAPLFWIGVLLVLAFHTALGWLPASHAAPPGGGSAVERLRHLALPLATLVLPAACAIARYQLAALSAGDGRDHVRRARAAGLSGWALAWRHRLRPTLGPSIALLGLDLPALVSGAVVVEMVFAWPGVGRLTAEAILENDYPLALAATMLTASVTIVGRFGARALARWNDPRVDAEAAVRA